MPQCRKENYLLHMHAMVTQWCFQNKTNTGQQRQLRLKNARVS